MRTRVPRPGALSTVMSPPWRSTIFFTMDMPSPVPEGLVVKNGRKILSRVLGRDPDAVVDHLHDGAVALDEEIDLDASAAPARLDGLERVLA